MLFGNFRNACHRFADGIIAHQCNTIISVACAVVEILFPTKIGTPIGQIGNILLLYRLPAPAPACAAPQDRLENTFAYMPCGLSS
jgi:hypothetical protein